MTPRQTVLSIHPDAVCVKILKAWWVFKARNRVGNIGFSAISADCAWVDAEKNVGSN